MRAEGSNDQCLLVIIGVRPDGTKERVAIGEGFAETKEAWTDLLLDLKKRGLATGPLLATGDGALGFWAAMQVRISAIVTACFRFSVTGKALVFEGSVIVV